MPSPFPGMDPYLEDPGLWPDVHHELISGIRERLNRLIRPKYVARVEERIYVSDEEDPGRSVLVPDVRVNERVGRGNGGAGPSGPVVAVDEPLVVTTLIEEEIHESRVEILETLTREVVTVIEVVSPANKVGGARGRESYQRKRRAVMTSPCHWVEIDLLRRGLPTFSRELLPPCEYVVHVSRVEQRPRGRVWPVRLTSRLPVVGIPLRGGDPDAALELQEVLNTCYDRAAYDVSIDYRHEPDPPLPPELAAWADQLLRERGLRPTPPV
jgi:hypothetical protein